MTMSAAEKTVMDKDAEILRLRLTLAELRALHTKVNKLLSDHYIREVEIFRSNA